MNEEGPREGGRKVRAAQLCAEQIDAVVQAWRASLEASTDQELGATLSELNERLTELSARWPQ
jgi:uncharacterized protein YceH (UPF0502 family)